MSLLNSCDQGYVNSNWNYYSIICLFYVLTLFPFKPLSSIHLRKNPRSNIVKKIFSFQTIRQRHYPASQLVVSTLINAYLSEMCILCACLSTGLICMRQHLDQMAEAEEEQISQHSSDEDDFFSSVKSRRSQGTGELEDYLICVSNERGLLN